MALPPESIPNSDPRPRVSAFGKILLAVLVLAALAVTALCWRVPSRLRAMREVELGWNPRMRPGYIVDPVEYEQHIPRTSYLPPFTATRGGRFRHRALTGFMAARQGLYNHTGWKFFTHAYEDTPIALALQGEMLHLTLSSGPAADMPLFVKGLHGMPELRGLHLHFVKTPSPEAFDQLAKALEAMPHLEGVRVILPEANDEQLEAFLRIPHLSELYYPHLLDEAWLRKIAALPEFRRLLILGHADLSRQIAELEKVRPLRSHWHRRPAGLSASESVVTIEFDPSRFATKPATKPPTTGVSSQ